MIKRLSVFFAFLVFFLLTPPAYAVSFRSGDSVNIGKDEVISGSLYTAGTTVTVDGVVDGDVYCAGQHVVINGTVNGDIFCAGQSVTVRGDVSGNVRIVGQMVTIEGLVDRNVTLLGQTTTISDASVINGEVALRAQASLIEGSIGREIYGGAENMTINGAVAGDVTVDVGTLSIGRDAAIAGNVTYTSQNDISMQGDAIGGTVVKKLPPIEATNHRILPAKKISGGNVFVWGLLKSIVLYLLLGVLVLVLFPSMYKKHLDIVGHNIARTMGTGFLVCVIVPILLMICVITIIGIPVTILGAILFGLSYIIGRLIVFLYVGKHIVKQFPKYKAQSQWVGLLVGIVASVFVLHIPFIGWLFSALATCWGFGVLYRMYRLSRKKAS